MRVLEVAGRVPAASAGRALRLLGADVVKVEIPEGDPLTGYGPFAAPPIDGAAPTNGGLFAYLTRGKRLEKPQKNRWLDTVRGLASKAEVVLADELAWSLNPLELSDEGAAVVYFTTMGLDGPRSGDPSRPLTRFHLGGAASLLPSGEADPEHPPIREGVLSGELQAGYAGACAALLAFLQSMATDRGSLVEFCQYEFHVTLNKGFMAFVLDADMPVERSGQGLPLRGVFSCSDGWVMVLTPESHHWRLLTDLIGKPEWGPLGVAERTQRESEIVRTLDDWFSGTDKTEAYRLLQAAGIPAAPVLEPQELLTTPYFSIRGFWEGLGEEFPGIVGPRLAFQTNSTADPIVDLPASAANLIPRDPLP